jgi:hypothetical protein
MNYVFFFLLFNTFATMNAFQLSSRRLANRNSVFCTQRTRISSSSSQQFVFHSYLSRWQSSQSPQNGSGHGYTYKAFEWARGFSSKVLDQEPELFNNDLLADIDDSDDDVDEDEDEHLDYTTTRYQPKSDNEEFFDQAEMDANRIDYPKGTPEGFYVTKQYTVPEGGFENLVTNTEGSEGAGVTQEMVNRLGISGTNITLPIALMLLDAEAYPSVSRARKSCR